MLLVIQDRVLKVGERFELVCFLRDGVVKIDVLSIGVILFDYAKVVLLSYERSNIASFTLYCEQDLLLKLVDSDSFDHTNY